MRKHRKHKFVRWILIVSALVLFAVFGLLYFLVSNNAPVLYGEVLHHQTYKEDLSLDIYFPTQKIYDKDPVVLYVHGGAWIGGSKEVINVNRFNLAVNQLRELGYTVVCPDYTLARNGNSPFPDCVIDVYDALNWVEQYASHYNFDLNNVGVIGESAGAHLAMMLAYPAKDFLLEVTPKNIELRYVIDVYGPAYLPEMLNMPLVDSVYQIIQKLPASFQKRLDIVSTLFGFDPAIDTIKAQEFMTLYSPYNYVNELTPPTLIIHGDADKIVPFSQSSLLHQKLIEMDVETNFLKIPEAEHGFIGLDADSKKSYQNEIVKFISAHYHTIKD